MSEGKEERAAGVMDENTKDEGKEDLAREEDGGNILDDILNTKEEKFEDEDMVKKDEEEDDDNDLDLGDEDSPGGREENSRKGPESDFSDSEDEESKAILRDGRDSEMSFKEESRIDSGSESSGEKEVGIKKERDNEEGEDEKDGGAEDETNVAKEGVEEGEEEDGEEKKKRKEKKSYDYATKLNYLFRETRFFLVKSNNAENVSLAKAKNVWSTPPQNESKFNQAYAESRNVLLIYSVKESGKFCGVARLSTESRRDGPKVSWLLPPGLSAKALGGVFHLDWICRGDLSFQKVQHLYNPWNEGKPVKIGRDGQEIEPKVAEELCRLFPEDPTVDMTPILRRSKEAARVQRAKGVVRKSGPLGGARPPRPSGRGSSRGRGHIHQGAERERKRRYEEDMGSHREKWARYDDRRAPMYHHRMRSPPRYGPPTMDRRTEYPDYMRGLSHQPPPAYYSYPHHHPGYPPPHTRYYEGPPPTYRGRDESRSRSDYHREVEEFLRRTADRPRERDRDRRHRR